MAEQRYRKPRVGSSILPLGSMKTRSSVSRLRRVEQKRAVKTAIWGLVLVAALLGLVVKFGIPLLIQLAVLLTKPDSFPPENPDSQILSAPTLDALPEATPSAKIHVTGFTLANTTVEILVNGQVETQTLSQDGRFDLPVELADGANIISAQAKNSSGGQSPFSASWEVIRDAKPPTLSITSPADKSSTQGNSQKIIEITGQTETDATILINGRLTIISADGKFSFRFQQNDGDNPLTVVARDRAGNQTISQLLITWHP